jgi:hypothetical protein
MTLAGRSTARPVLHLVPTGPRLEAEAAKPRVSVLTGELAHQLLSAVRLLQHGDHLAPLALADPGATIDAVFIINGGLFADPHSHPWDTTPMLKTPVGRAATWLGQHLPGGLDQILGRAKLFSPSYVVSAPELADLSDAIRRRGGAAFLHRGAGFVDERRRNAERWDLAAIVRELGDTVAFHVAGSEEDPFEARQSVAARERRGPFGVEIQWFPGGHLTASEHPDLLADAIRGVARAQGVGQPIPHASAPTGDTTP